MTVATSLSYDQVRARVRLRKLTYGDLRLALRQGWEDYLDRRGELLMIGLIYPVAGLILCAAAFQRDLIPIIFPLAAGISLMGPPLASGFYELARRRDAGEDGDWRHAFDVLSGRRLAALAVLTLASVVLFGFWILCAWEIYDHTLGHRVRIGGDFFSLLFTTRAGWTMMILGDLVGLLFAIAALAFSAISFAMVVDGAGPLTAVETSLRSVTKNPGAYTAWGVTVAALLVLGSIPLFIGLALVLPVLGYATWRLYRRAVEV